MGDIAALNLGIALCLLLGLALRLDVVEMLRDPQASSPLVASRPWIGALSLIGSVLWAAASACCLLGAWACRVGGATRESQFLCWTGVVLGGLGADDTFVIHDYLVPRLTGVAEAEVLVFAVLAFGVALWALNARDLLWGPAGLPLVPVAVCFAASMAIELLVGEPTRRWLVVEDGAKLAGIVTLLYTSVWWTQRFVRPLLARRPQVTTSGPELQPGG